MRQIVRRIITLSNEIPQMDGVIETRGNLDFIEILNSYPEFVEGVKGFEKKKRGRPTDNPSPEEVEYLVHLVESLYIEKGKTYKISYSVNSNEMFASEVILNAYRS